MIQMCYLLGIASMADCFEKQVAVIKDFVLNFGHVINIIFLSRDSFLFSRHCTIFLLTRCGLFHSLCLLLHVTFRWSFGLMMLLLLLALLVLRRCGRRGKLLFLIMRWCLGRLLMFQVVMTLAAFAQVMIIGASRWVWVFLGWLGALLAPLFDRRLLRFQLSIISFILRWRQCFRLLEWLLCLLLLNARACV